MIRSAFCVLLVLLKTNQYKKNTMGKKTAKDNELKNINIGTDLRCKIKIYSLVPKQNVAQPL